MFNKGKSGGISRRDTATYRQSMFSERVLERTDVYVINVKNSPVSVKVQEVIKADKLGTSLKLHSSGWSWIVSGTSVYFWRYSLEQPSSSCYQLSLPPNSSVNKFNSSLVDIYTDPRDSSNISIVVAVSPDGIVRYWKGVSKDSSYKEHILDLNGDRAHSVAKLERASGFVVLTTGGSLYLLGITSFQVPLFVLPLVPPKSVFSGIGKRVSSLFFGSGTLQKSPEVAVKLITWYCTERDFDVVVVMTKTNIQSWKVYSAQEYDQVLLLDCNLLSLLKEEIDNQYSSNDQSQTSYKVSLLDLQFTCEGLLILYALADEVSTPSTIKYGLAQLLSFLDSTSLTIGRLVDLPFNQTYSPETESHFLDVALQGCSTSPQLVVYGKHFVIPIYIHKENDESNTLVSDVHFAPPNAIVGSGVYENRDLLLFTLQHGIVSVTAFSQSEALSPPKRPKPTSYISKGHYLAQFTKSPPPESVQEETELLRSAFMSYINNNLVDATTKCNGMFPSTSFLLGLDTPGDVSVKRLSEMILNDQPASDPRWGDTSINEYVGSGSVIIINQLHDKQEAHRRFVQFLTDVGLLDLLTCVTVRGRPMSTRLLLCENAEKIVAAIVLKKMPSQYVDEPIKRVVQERVSVPRLSHCLSAQDIFYSQVTNIDDIFKALLDYSDTLICSSDSLVDSLSIITNIASIIQAMLHEAQQYRIAHSNLYVSCKPLIKSEPEYLPWTAHDESFDILRRILSSMLSCWSDCQGEVISDIDQQSFWNVYFELAVILYSGLDELISSTRKTNNRQHEFEVEQVFKSDKKRYIESALKSGNVQVALQLAEQYCYFPTLVQVCEDHNNPELLKKYFDQFNSKGFGDHVFKHYLDNGNPKKLLAFSKLFPSELGKFLSGHPDISWIHQLAVQDYQKVSQALSDLALKEQNYLAKKKTIYSIKKLSLLCSNDKHDAELRETECELRIIECQEKIRSDLLEKAGFQFNLEPPLPPEQVVEFFLSDDDDATCLNSYLYSLQYISLAFPDISNCKLRLYIWSNAALKTDWSSLNTDEPLEQLEGTFFFKLFDESYRSGLDVTRLLPTFDELINSPYLADEGLSRNNVFVFFMKIGYEQLLHFTQ